MSAPRPRSWKSRADALVIAAIALTAGGCFALGAYLLSLGARGALPGIGVLSSGVLSLLLFLPVRYTIDGELLRIRSGLFRWTIPLPLITEVRRASRGVGPALSFRRLAVAFRTPEGVERVLISPRQEESFLAELRSAAPAAAIHVDDEEPVAPRSASPAGDDRA